MCYDAVDLEHGCAPVWGLNQEGNFMLRIALVALLVGTMVVGSGCKTHKSNNINTAVVTTEDAGSNREELEASLRALVEKEVTIANRTSKTNRDELVNRKPYWYREYVEYTDGTSNMQVKLIETESLSRPYQAEVSLDKVRFATRLHRERKRALEDSSYLRDTGTEVLSYELRGNRWSRTGSMFVAERTEEQVNGTWTPVNEQETIAVQAEESTGFLNKAWSIITGR